jgi:hypothetical protein
MVFWLLLVALAQKRKRKMNKRSSIIAASLIMLAGCHSIPSSSGGGDGLTYSGESHADETLRSDTTKMVKMIAGGQGCKSIEHINTKVLHYEAMNGEKGHVWGKEGWMATSCGKPYPFYVTFTEDGNGGTFFDLKPVQR